MSRRKPPPPNTALRDALRGALAGTRLEQHVYEADARAVAAAQEQRKHARYRAKRAAARREAMLAS